MLTTIEGTYEGGQVLLSEVPLGVQRARVLVTFLSANQDASRTASDSARVGRISEGIANLQRNWGHCVSSSTEFAAAKRTEVELEERRG